MNRAVSLPVILFTLAITSCKGTEGDVFLGLGADASSQDGSSDDRGLGDGSAESDGSVHVDGGSDSDGGGSVHCDGGAFDSDGSVHSDGGFESDGGHQLGDGSVHCDGGAFDSDASQSSDGGSDDGGTGDGGGIGDGGSTGVDCTQNPPVFPSFDRSCATAADCALGTVQINCCGSMTVTGINEIEEARFAQAAAECGPQFPQCGCPSLPTIADDGTFEVNSGPAIVQCIANICQSTFPPTPTPCGGSLTCDPLTEVCVATGPIGPAITYACEPIPSGCDQDRTCSCPGISLCNSPFDACSETGPNQILCECLQCT